MEQKTLAELDAVKAGPLESGVSSRGEEEAVLSKEMTGSCLRGTGELNIMSE